MVAFMRAIFPAAIGISMVLLRRELLVAMCWKSLKKNIAIVLVMKSAILVDLKKLYSFPFLI